MENKNQPAYPTDLYSEGKEENAMWIGSARGLTKREYFVGQIISGDISGMANTPDPKKCAEFAVKFADELLKQLESLNP